MALVLIRGESIRGNLDNSKMANLKIYRDLDKKELSFSFDNSCGAFGDRLSRMQVAIFSDSESSDPEYEDYNLTSREFANLVNDFVAGRIAR